MKEILLISRAVRGNREALGELVRLYYGKIYNYIFYRVLDRALAEDLTQDVFVKLTKSIHSYVPTASFSTFLYRIAANTVIDARERFIAIYERSLAPSLATDDLERELAELEAEINIAAELVEECIRENAHVALDQAEYQKRYDSLAARYDKAKTRHDEVTELIADRTARRKQIGLYFRELRKRQPLETFREEDWLSMVDHMTVYSKDDIRVTFKDGTEIET